MDGYRLLLLLFCVAGIYSAYLTQGLVAENFSVKRYGEQQERLSHLEGLNGAQSLCCFIWAWIILQVMQAAGQVLPDNLAPWHAYWKTGVANSFGPAFGMVALKNITYSAQVLVKSCKMVPVMLMGTILHGKRYNPIEYLCMSLIGVGVALFGQKSSSSVANKLANPNTGLGYLLCGLNLGFDGYTNSVQDKINEHYPRNSPVHMMCWMNFWTALTYAVYLLGSPVKCSCLGLGLRPFFVIFWITPYLYAGYDLISFLLRHPDAARDVLVFCLCGAFGQLFIFLTIKTFGSLTNTLVCTTRKFFNILISVVVNGNPLLPIQWVAVFMVFSGLIASTLLKSRVRHKHKLA